MALADELKTLQELHANGKLTHQEYSNNAIRNRAIGRIALRFVFLGILVLSNSTARASSRPCDNVDLAKKENRWHIELVPPPSRYYYLARVNGALSTRGPWFIDTNHQEAREIVVLAAFNNNSENCGVLNLADAILDTTLSLQPPTDSYKEDIPGSEVTFWFQSTLGEDMPGYGPRLINYVFTKSAFFTVPAGPPWKGPWPLVRRKVILSSRIQDWTCLSRNRRDVRQDVGSAQKYTCAVDQDDFRRALENQNASFGFILLLPRKTPDGRPLVWANPTPAPCPQNSNGPHTPILGTKSFCTAEPDDGEAEFRVVSFTISPAHPK